MKIWLITSIRMRPGRALPAPALQNLRTAEALCLAGHQVALWAAETPPDPVAFFTEYFGRPAPGGMRFLRYTPRGERDGKKTPFARVWDRWRHARRAGKLLGGAPDAIVTRSPLALVQLRATASPAWRGARLILEWQYPESMQLWRGWRRRNRQAPLSECVRRLKRWRREELAALKLADGILYAARDHQRLLRQAGWAGPAAMLPSACEPPAPPAGPLETDYEYGYLGALAPENGLETAIKALAKLDEGRLALIGNGKAQYAGDLRELASRLGVLKRIDFIGAVAPRETAAWMRRCRTGLAPMSRRAGPEKRQFASPLKLVEWMGAGVPAVAGAAPSVTGLFAPGRELSLVRCDDAEALAGAMARLNGDEALRSRLIENGLAYAALHDFSHRAKTVVDFIESL